MVHRSKAGDRRVHDRGFAGTRGLAGLATAAAVAALLAACSPGADYPSVLDKPMPHADQTLTQQQVQQATDALKSDRDQLNSQAQAAQAEAVASGMAPPATTGTTPSAGATRKP